MCADEWESLKLVFSDSYRSKLSTFILMCPVGVYIYELAVTSFSTPTNIKGNNNLYPLLSTGKEFKSTPECPTKLY